MFNNNKHFRTDSAINGDDGPSGETDDYERDFRTSSVIEHRTDRKKDSYDGIHTSLFYSSAGSLKIKTDFRDRDEYIKEKYNLREKDKYKTISEIAREEKALKFASSDDDNGNSKKNAPLVLEQARDLCNQCQSGWTICDETPLIKTLVNDTGYLIRTAFKVAKLGGDGKLLPAVLKIEHHSRERSDHLMATLASERSDLFNACIHWTYDEATLPRLNSEPYDVHIFEWLETLEYLCKEQDILLPNRAKRQRALFDIGTNIAEGLTYLHSRGYFHKDIKPSNIMLKVEGNRFKAQIIDMGSAVKIGSDGCAYTKTDGTTKFMRPPELQDISVFKCTKSYDFYCLGLSLLIHGVHLIKYYFEDDSIIINDIHIGEFARECEVFDPKYVLHRCGCREDQINEFFTEKMLDIIYCCCSANPDERYNDGELLLEHLTGKLTPPRRPITAVGYRYAFRASDGNSATSRLNLSNNKLSIKNGRSVSFKDFLCSFDQLYFRDTSPNGKIFALTSSNWSLMGEFKNATVTIVEAEGSETILHVSTGSKTLSVCCIACCSEDEALIVHSNYDRLKAAHHSAGAFIDPVLAQLTGKINDVSIAIIISSYSDTPGLRDAVEAYSTLNDPLATNFNTLKFTQRLDLFVRIEAAVSALLDNGVPLASFDVAKSICVDVKEKAIHICNMNQKDMLNIVDSEQSEHYRRICADAMSVLMQCSLTSCSVAGSNGNVKLSKLPVANLPCSASIKEYISSVLLCSNDSDDIRRKLGIKYGNSAHLPNTAERYFQLYLYFDGRSINFVSPTHVVLSSILKVFPDVPLRFAGSAHSGVISCYTADTTAFKKVSVLRDTDRLSIGTTPIELYDNDLLVCGTKKIKISIK